VRVQLNPLCPEAARLAERAAAQGWRVLPRQTHLLDLRPGLPALRRGYHATKRNQVAKPVKIDSRIAQARTEADLQSYFEVYAHSLQRWGRAGAWPYPRQLFLDLLHSSAVRIWTHHVQGRLACAVVILESRHQALYWQGVSRIDEDQKAAHPMVRLMDAVIQDLCARGVPVLNLGASEGLPQVQRFKEEFGAQPLAYSALQWESTVWRWLQRVHSLRAWPG
jgi:CelD/BcsL family acetyltransferase involved in cellulose biosynthesis